MLMTQETPWLPAVDATDTDASKDASESKRANGPEAVPGRGRDEAERAATERGGVGAEVEPRLGRLCGAEEVVAADEGQEHVGVAGARARTACVLASACAGAVPSAASVVASATIVIVVRNRIRVLLPIDPAHPSGAPR